MKKTLLTLVLAVAAVAAFGQGKISMLNDASRALTSIYGVPISNTGPGASLLIDLYCGFDASSMILQTTTVLSAADGLFGPRNVALPNFPGGVTITMQVKVRESSYATAELAQANGGYYGYSPVFTMKPSTTIAYNSIINPGGTSLSTWGPGAIFVFGIPEPSSLSLALLGVGALVVARRRRAGRS